MENIGFVEKIKGFLFSPTETFKKLKEESLSDSLKYFVILLFIQSLLNAIVLTYLLETVWGFLASIYKNIPGFEAIYAGGSTTFFILLFVIFLVLGLIGIFISGAIIHLGVLLFGGKRGYKETIKAIIYGGTPGYLFGWIPFLSIIFALWAFILEIFGIKEFQDLSTGKAIAAILLPIIIIFGVIMVIIVLFMFVYVTHMVGGTL